MKHESWTTLRLLRGRIEDNSLIDNKLPPPPKKKKVIYYQNQFKIY